MVSRECKSASPEYWQGKMHSQIRNLLERPLSEHSATGNAFHVSICVCMSCWSQSKCAMCFREPVKHCYTMYRTIKMPSWFDLTVNLSEIVGPSMFYVGVVPVTVIPFFLFCQFNISSSYGHDCYFCIIVDVALLLHGICSFFWRTDAQKGMYIA
jgi:hypothetical protein